MTDSTKRDFDKEAAQWDENPSRVKLANDIFVSISEHVQLKASMRVMDFGCGTGLLSLKVAPLVNAVTGIDSSRGMLDVFREKVIKQNIGNVTVRLVDLEKGDSLEGMYDLIVSSMTLHHVEKIEPLLKQFYKCLLPGGLVCITDLDLDQGMFHDDNQGVFHFGFDRSAMQRRLSEAGFDKIHDYTASELKKPVLSGEVRGFTVFLMVGQRPAV
jgi:2-polyprenyl-3-methyl-5-hydroxy-6-metoxy-1,4-benzoquinol methylase